jgi:DNA mismatch repair ATPase MutS
MSEPVVQKIVLPAIPDGFLTQIGDDYQLTQIQVGDQAISIDVFLQMLEGSLELSELTVYRSEKRSKTKYETYDYSASWKLSCEATNELLKLVPDGPQRLEARKMVGRMLTKRLKEIEEFLSRAIHSAQQKDGIPPYWREGQKPVF